MTLEELRADFAAQGQPAFHALQVYRWLHRGVRSFSEMSDQSKAFRQKLSERYYIAAASSAAVAEPLEEAPVCPGFSCPWAG